MWENKELGPLPSHLLVGERWLGKGCTWSCPPGFRSTHERAPVCLLSLEQKFRSEALIFYNHQWITWGDGKDENKTKESKHETNQRQKQTSVVNLNTPKRMERSRERHQFVPCMRFWQRRELFHRWRGFLEQNNSQYKCTFWFFLRERWNSLSNSSTKHRGFRVVSLWESLGDAGNNSLCGP